MLQRIQSVFLFLAAVVMIAFLFLPIWGKVDFDAREVINLNAFQLVYTQESLSGEVVVIAAKDTFWISVVAILAAGVALFSIFQYKNRLRQIQLGALNALLMGGTIGLSYYYSTIGEQMLPTEYPGEYKIGFYIIIAALLFNMLANRFIRKDEKLVRSADRIR
jgi:hypothetical protein